MNEWMNEWIQYNTIQYSALFMNEYNTIQLNTNEYNTIQYNAFFMNEWMNE